MKQVAFDLEGYAAKCNDTRLSRTLQKDVAGLRRSSESLRNVATLSIASNQTPEAVICQRCNGDQFISGAYPDLPDEPCPVCNSGAPSGAERVRAHASASAGPQAEAVIEDLRVELRKLAIKQHVRPATHSTFVSNGKSCAVCKGEWEDGDPEHHALTCCAVPFALQQSPATDNAPAVGANPTRDDLLDDERVPPSKSPESNRSS